MSDSKSIRHGDDADGDASMSTVDVTKSARRQRQHAYDMDTNPNIQPVAPFQLVPPSPASVSSSYSATVPSAFINSESKLPSLTTLTMKKMDGKQKGGSLVAQRRPAAKKGPRIIYQGTNPVNDPVPSSMGLESDSDHKDLDLFSSWKESFNSQKTLSPLSKKDLIVNGSTPSPITTIVRIYPGSLETVPVNIKIQENVHKMTLKLLKQLYISQQEPDLVFGCIFNVEFWDQDKKEIFPIIETLDNPYPISKILVGGTYRPCSYVFSILRTEKHIIEYLSDPRTHFGPQTPFIEIQDNMLRLALETHLRLANVPMIRCQMTELEDFLKEVIATDFQTLVKWQDMEQVAKTTQTRLTMDDSKINTTTGLFAEGLKILGNPLLLVNPLSAGGSGSGSVDGLESKSKPIVDRNSSSSETILPLVYKHKLHLILHSKMNKPSSVCLVPDTEKHRTGILAEIETRAKQQGLITSQRLEEQRKAKIIAKAEAKAQAARDRCARPLGPHGSAGYTPSMDTDEDDTDNGKEKEASGHQSTIMSIMGDMDSDAKMDKLTEKVEQVAIREVL